MGSIELFELDDLAPRLPPEKSVKAHAGGVSSVAFSPDGPFLASGGADAKIRLWNTTTLGPIREMPGRDLPGHTAKVTSVAFNDDSTRIVSASNDKTIYVGRRYGVRVGDPMRGHGGFVLTVDFVADSNEIVSGGNEHIMRLWDAEIGQPISTPITSGTAAGGRCGDQSGQPPDCVGRDRHEGSIVERRYRS